MPLCNPSGGNLLRQSHIQNSVKHQRWNSDRIPNADPARDAVNLGVGGLQVHGIGNQNQTGKENQENWEYDFSASGTGVILGNGCAIQGKKICCIQARHQEFFRTGEFSWNQSTLINIHLQHKKEKPRREKSPIFFPGNSLKIAF